MKFFEITRIQMAIRHLEKFDSNWILVPLVLAANGVGISDEVDIAESGRMGGDHFLDQFFNGALIGLPPFDNGHNSLRPRFSELLPNMRSQGKEDDFVYHQPTKLWANVYSSRGYREMRMAGFLSGERSVFKMQPTFQNEWRRRVAPEFKFEELLVWLFAFQAVPENVASWDSLNSAFQKRYVVGDSFSAAFQVVFRLTANYPWPESFLKQKPQDCEYQRELIASRKIAHSNIKPSLEIELAPDRNSANDVEGIDEGRYQESETYPIDDVFIRQEQKTVFEVTRRIRSGKLILDPDFQRDFIWSEDRQSKLIESALMRIPLPVFYLAENKGGKTVIVDGLQRLTTFTRFLNNEFTLQGLPTSSELNTKTYEDLSPMLQSRIEDTNLILYVIDHKVPERAKLDIFERVNSGVPLSRQQMRNCMYVGPATKWLKAHANNMAFLKATGSSLASQMMRDREVVNRFCGFAILGVDKFKGDLDQFLADTLDAMNQMPESELKELSVQFERSMKNNFEVFGRYAFRKHWSGTDRRNPLNVALFDVYSVIYSELDESIVIHNRDKLHAQFYSLLSDNVFIDAITSSTNDPKKVFNRFAKVEESISKMNLA